jgi:hypothetical protein
MKLSRRARRWYKQAEKDDRIHPPFHVRFIEAAFLDIMKPTRKELAVELWQRVKNACRIVKEICHG